VSEDARMSIPKLIMQFAMREIIPVQVADVVEAIKALGVTDQIRFYDVDIDTNVLKGVIEQWIYEEVTGQPGIPVAEISTAKSLSPTEKRLVECKELLHLLDPQHFRVNTFAGTEALIDKIVVPLELQDPANDGVHAVSDRIAIFYALAVLFPKAVRDLFMQPYKEGSLSLEHIAQMVDLPIYYVVAAMSDHWAIIHGRMIRPQRIAGPDRVSTLDVNNKVLQVVSVGTTENPYSYARSLWEADQKTSGQIAAFLIEMSNGESHTLTAEEVLTRAPR
jgi:hypothetical protein